ncbi:hypothetical protein RhiirC2_789883 [Rhizophagus irregularis]|uniref:Uncharacterized protein n=1 Tax=Rhizophagus irregularis TaxID=588596 RepID=A0A2N1ME41_9GLOM|nr:hypothetical protein RhiirC2_794123 [Rhizophagus irregularis]PKK62765.1 hypothetical protein RhiirC2_789883 [Rhizophagus irregularis]
MQTYWKLKRGNIYCEYAYTSFPNYKSHENFLCETFIAMSRDKWSRVEIFTKLSFFNIIINIGTINSKSGFGWLQTNPSSPQLTFNGSTIIFPSSFKSESLAILTILLVLPFHAICHIYTDSQNCIDIFNQKLLLPTIIHLVKVKGHSNNKGNDQADALAKEGSKSDNPILVDHKFFKQSSLALFNYNHIYIIDRNVRKWSNTPIQSRIFNMAMNNSSMSPINHQITHGDIDWHYTKQWINFNPTDTPTSTKLRNIQSSKIKKSTFNYPTGNILQRNYPLLYPSDESIALNQKLIDLIKAEHTSSFSFDIECRINNSNMFKLLPNIIDTARQADNITQIRIPREQPWILLLHHLIPRDLAVFFDNYFKEKLPKEQITPRITSPLTADDTPPAAPSQHRKQYTRYYHNKVLPYFKQLVNIDVSAYIRWTTCNFLHSGTWESYRDNLLFDLDQFSPIQSFLDSHSPPRT